MKYRTKYIGKALAVFRQEGLRLPIEELAEKMGITKKTLYNHFSSKEELLAECIQSVFSELNTKMLILCDPERNAVDCMKEGFREMKAFFIHQSPVFISDLKRMYPDMVTERHTSGYGNFQEKIMLNLEKGIREGLYHKDMDRRLISRYIMYSVFGFFINSVTTDSEFSSAGYFDTIIGYNLRALVTDKGRDILTMKDTNHQSRRK